MSFKPPFTFISARQLAEMMKPPKLTEEEPEQSSTLPKKFQVVDVRDDDFVGGHIKGAINQPSATFLSGGIEQLREKVMDVPVLIFHCALSQVRGPKSARIYKETTDLLRQHGGKAPIEQEILVLRGGFTEFQALYKDDKDLVEDYNKHYWDTDY